MSKGLVAPAAGTTYEKMKRLRNTRKTSMKEKSTEYTTDNCNDGVYSFSAVIVTACVAVTVKVLLVVLVGRAATTSSSCSSNSSGSRCVKMVS